MKYFKHLTKKNKPQTYILNLIIKTFSLTKQYDKLYEFYILNQNNKLNCISYNFLIDAWGRSQNLYFIKDLLKKFHHKFDENNYNSIIEAFYKCG